MNVYVVDTMGSGLDFALRCMRDGHHVRVCMGIDKHTKQRTRVGDGLIEKIEGEEWQRSMAWADLIVLTDNTRWLREIDTYRARGFPIFGPSAEAAALELDRAGGQRFLADHRIKVMPAEMFSDFRAAEKLVLKTGKRYVAKPNGDQDKSLSYVSKSARDMIYTLRAWDARPKLGKIKFMLQEFVGGCEFAINAWLGPAGYATFVEESFEHKKLMPGDFGPNTGEMGTAIKYVHKNQSALFNEVLRPLEADLIKMGLTGSVNVAVIVDEDGEPRPLEFTTRLGWPAFNIVQPLHPDPAVWMLDLLHGSDTFRPRLDHAVGVVLAIPPFPYEHPEMRKQAIGVPVYNFNPDNEWFDNLGASMLMDGMAPNDEGVNERCMVSAGDYLAIATGLGESVRDAAADAYEAVESLEVPGNLIVRNDIGLKVKKALPLLQDAGFASEWRF